MSFILKKIATVGWSDGADIGLDIAINHPERFTKLLEHLMIYSNYLNIRIEMHNPSVLLLSLWIMDNVVKPHNI